MRLKHNGNWADEVVTDVTFNHSGVMYSSFDERRKNVLLCLFDFQEKWSRKCVKCGDLLMSLRVRRPVL